MDLNKLKSIIKKEAVSTILVDQVKDDVRVYKNQQLGVIEEREQRVAPITRELGGVRQQMTNIDKRQDEMISQLKENQNAMIQYLPQLAIEPSKSMSSIAAPPEFEVPEFDPRFLKKYRLPSPNYLLHEPLDVLESYDKKVYNFYNNEDNSSEDDEQLSIYIQTIRTIISQLNKKSQPTVSGYHNPMKAPKQTIYNANVVFNEEFLQEFNLPSLDKIPIMSDDEYNDMRKKTTRVQKSLGGQKSAAKSAEEREIISKKLHLVKDYKATAELTRSKNIQKMAGNGINQQRKRNAYKLSKGGSFGKLYIDPAKLRKNRLSVKDKAGNSLIDNVVDNSLIDLLTKRYNPKVEYTPEAKDIFKDLTRFSGIKKSKRSGKQKLLGGSTVTLVPDTPKDILARLTLLLGTRRAGNNSLDIRNEIVQLIDIAYSKKIISNEEKGRLTTKNNLN